MVKSAHLMIQRGVQKAFHQKKKKKKIFAFFLLLVSLVSDISILGQFLVITHTKTFVRKIIMYVEPRACSHKIYRAFQLLYTIEGPVA